MPRGPGPYRVGRMKLGGSGESSAPAMWWETYTPLGYVPNGPSQAAP
jgi:hypothetical protein